MRDGGTTVPIPAGNQQVVLAALLLNANKVVPAGTLVDLIWTADPPTSARVTLQNYVKRLRQALGDATHSRIATHPPGYLIRLEPGELDVAVFETLLSQAREAARAGSWDAAAGTLRSALKLWQGDPLTGLTSDGLIAGEALRLQEMRLQALEERVEADLHLGRHAAAVAEMRQLTAAHSLREGFWRLLMLALYRCGRQADALAAYQQARRALDEDLGVQPGRDLRLTHQQILAADGRLELRLLGVSQRPPAPYAAPRQLPPPIPHFAVRSAEQEQLSGLLRERNPAIHAQRLAVLWGTAGVGKSALAVHWGHREAGHFPDGQLYVNLRGFGASGAAVSPARAIRWMLPAIGIPAQEIPPGAETQAALYRTQLAGKRMLIVLDNARDADQVRPLLAGGLGSLVLVTSRTEMTGLIATDGGCLLELNLLPAKDAVELLERRLGADRIAGEGAAAAVLARLCAGLPLALSVVAAHATARPRLPLAALAAELRGARSLLDALETGDAVSDVRAVLSWSYDQLSPPTARLFRLLGVHCGPDITAAAAASVAGVPLATAQALLGELTSAALVSEHAPGRFASHDLLKAFAAEQARTLDSEAEIHRAVNRALDHYLHTSRDAAMLLYPARDPIELSPAAPATTLEPLADNTQALAWCDAERPVLIAATAQADSMRFDTHAWQLPRHLAAFFDFRGHWDDGLACHKIALGAATRLQNTSAQARAHRYAAGSLARLGRRDAALYELAAAIELYRAMKDPVGLGHAEYDTAWVCELQGHVDDAIRHGQRALDAYQAGTYPRGQAMALNRIGWYHALVGDMDQAISWTQEALAIDAQIGNPHCEADSMETLGLAYSSLGHHAEAVSAFQRGVDLYTMLGDQVCMAETLDRLGDARNAATDSEGARQAWHDALAIFEDIHDPRADNVRAKISS